LIPEATPAAFPGDRPNPPEGFSRIRVVIAGPCRSTRLLLKLALEQQDDLHVAATADDAASTRLQAARVGAQVVIISNPLTGTLFRCCELLSDLEPPPGLLIVDEDAHAERLLDAIEAGADGYLEGHEDVDAVGEGVRSVARGESVIPPSMLGPLLRRLIQRRRDAAEAAERLVGLTRREREVLSHLVDGLDPQAIGTVLSISPETARTHVQRVVRKLGVHSRKEAIAMVRRAGLVDQLESMVERSTI
jgi:DNA-binding NarL/FixJ family response regulator